MINPYFKNRFPFVYDYFSGLFDLINENKRNFPQSLIFEGTNTVEQLLFSYELARLNNCMEKKEDNCVCTNCKWIRNFQHPAINIVSQIHYKPEDDDTKTKISVKQAKQIEHDISISSDYHRFFIFISSKKGNNYNQNDLYGFNKLGYSIDNIDYSIESVNHLTFHPNAINSLLKSIEEPQTKVTFIFLTKSKEDILPTIVSRSQIFKLSGNKNISDYKNKINIFSFYPNISYQNYHNIQNSFLECMKNENISIVELLNEFSEYLKDVLKNNLDNELYYKIENDIKIVNQAIKYSKAKINNNNLLETMFLRLARSC